MAKVQLYDRDQAPSSIVGVPQMDNSGAILAQAIGSSTGAIADSVNSVMSAQQSAARSGFNATMYHIGQQMRYAQAGRDAALKSAEKAITDVDTDNAKFQVFDQMDKIHNAAAQLPHTDMLNYYNKETTSIEDILDRPDVAARPAMKSELSAFITSQKMQHIASLRDQQVKRGLQDAKFSAENNMIAAEQSPGVTPIQLQYTPDGPIASPATLQSAFKAMELNRASLAKTLPGGAAEADARINLGRTNAIVGFIDRLTKENPDEAKILLAGLDGINLEIPGTDQTVALGRYVPAQQRIALEKHADTAIRQDLQEMTLEETKKAFVNRGEDFKMYAPASYLAATPENEAALESVRFNLEGVQQQIVTDIRNAKSPREIEQLTERGKQVNSYLNQTTSKLDKISSEREQGIKEEKRVTKEAEKEIKDLRKEQQIETYDSKANQTLRTQAAEDYAYVQRMTGRQIDPKDRPAIMAAGQRFLKTMESLSESGGAVRPGGRTDVYNGKIGHMQAMLSTIQTKKGSGENKIDILLQRFGLTPGKAKAISMPIPIGLQGKIDRSDEINGGVADFADAYEQKWGQAPSLNLLMQQQAREAKKLKDRYKADY